MRADAQALGNFLHGITPLGDLTRSVAFEIVAEITFAHNGLLASNLVKKVTINLGVPQYSDLACTCCIVYELDWATFQPWAE